MDDMDFLCEKAREFNDRYYGIPMREHGLRSYLEGMIEHEAGVVLLTDKGAICGFFTADPRWDWTVLVETAWYCEGRDGLRLLAAFEERALECGADEVRMTTLEVNPGVAKLLHRRGYTAIETSHRLLL
jgi:hypothetical protein